ncbi:uncharacterized protein FIESC28_07259 [Fusarium coffeatum]|uniref:Uncharacterized protein n=1 Tax=Fusarium coffeatum TaxID=231269 RepID=A0A366RGD0_9HYPO|nr:uncharacterized protein FIESC28_07259 [Fusarium coffeatum]RBR15618.1 hypothetical protein FIESC28_07259 [Fusarium coffeatum]
MSFPGDLWIKIIDFAISSQIASCVKGDTDDAKCRATQAMPEDNTLALKLSCRHIYQLIRALHRVDAIGSRSQAIFRISLRQDTLGGFHHTLPSFHARGGENAHLPVQELPVVPHLMARFNPLDDHHWNNHPFRTDLTLGRFPNVAKLSLILPTDQLNWIIEELKRDGPETDIYRNSWADKWGRGRWKQHDPGSKAYEDTVY